MAVFCGLVPNLVTVLIEADRYESVSNYWIVCCLAAGATIHPAKKSRPVLSQTFDKPANTVVAALKTMLVSEVLIDSLPTQPALQFVLDDFAEAFTLTLRPGFMGVLCNGPGGRVSGWF